MFRYLASVTVVALVLGACAHVVAAGPPPGARIVGIRDLTPTRAAVFIESPAMGRVVHVQILHPDGKTPRPTYYLLDGVDAGLYESDWTSRTDIVSFFADKDVNVVMPVGGRGSYYTNWQRPDPVLGAEEWETFLTSELPPLIDSALHGNGQNVIGGLSMGGGAAATLITRHPALYQGVAIFSGCPSTVNEQARWVIRESITRLGGNPDNMWGPNNDPAWQRHDPLTLAEALRGKAIYAAVGSGVPGPEDLREPHDLPAAVTFGAALEWATNMCIQTFQRRLDSLAIPAHFVYRNQGTHSWPYWQDALHDSWPILAAALDSQS